MEYNGIKKSKYNNCKYKHNVLWPQHRINVKVLRCTMCASWILYTPQARHGTKCYIQLKDVHPFHFPRWKLAWYYCFLMRCSLTCHYRILKHLLMKANWYTFYTNQITTLTQQIGNIIIFTKYKVREWSPLQIT